MRLSIKTVDNIVYQFLQTYDLNQGLKKYRSRAKNVADKEALQLLNRVAYKPIKVDI